MKDISNPSDPVSNILNIRTDYAFEVGGKFKRLHSHVIIDLTHNGFYQVNMALMREVINRYSGHIMHINVQAQKSASSIAWEKYFSKEIKH